MNIDLPALINAGSLELHYSEFGIGGGDRDTGALAAMTGPFAMAGPSFARVPGQLCAL